jgi:hemoglobin
MHRFRKLVIAADAVLSIALAVPFAAQAQALATVTPTPHLYNAFGAREGIKRLTDDFVQRITTNPKIADKFKDSNLKRLREKLEEQFCQIMGGPCVYTGDSMKVVHAGMGIHMADFNALVEDLQLSMDSQGIAFADQNALLALLAPMYKDMVKSKIDAKK